LSFVDRTFGFETAVARAAEAVTAAHVEAHSAMNGIGLVKLMGRESGFIAVHTVLAVHEANFVLIPEVTFEMDGPNGFLRHLEDRITRRSHAVVVVAEGAGQEFLKADGGKDASGNPKLGDIGVYLRDRIAEHFKRKGIDATVKYIDPSYMVRSSPAIPTDSAYCERLGNNAVHAAMGSQISCNEEWYYTPVDAVYKMPWHVLVKWRINVPAGFEGGTSIYINPFTPIELRDRLVPRLYKLRDEHRIAGIRIAEECRVDPHPLKYNLK